jgi:hypothetical protein
MWLNPIVFDLKRDQRMAISLTITILLLEFTNCYNLVSGFNSRFSGIGTVMFGAIVALLLLSKAIRIYFGIIV